MFPADRIITGALCYVMRAKAVLLLKRCRPPQVGMWSAPGGKLEHGESPHDGCIREMREETGLVIAQPMLRAVVTVVDVALPVHWLLFVFRADEAAGELVATEEGELRWIPLDELANYPRPYADEQHWAHILSDAPGIWQGKFVYDTPERLVSEQRYKGRGE